MQIYFGSGSSCLPAPLAEHTCNDNRNQQLHMHEPVVLLYHAKYFAAYFSGLCKAMWWQSLWRFRISLHLAKMENIFCIRFLAYSCSFPIFSYARHQMTEAGIGKWTETNCKRKTSLILLKCCKRRLSLERSGNKKCVAYGNKCQTKFSGQFFQLKKMHSLLRLHRENR